MGGLLGGLLFGLIDDLADARKRKAQVKEFEETYSRVIDGKGDSGDYNVVIFRFNENNDFDNILKYINEYKLRFDDFSDALKFFEAKGLFGLHRYDEAEPILNDLITLWDRTQIELVEVLMWLAIIHRFRGKMVIANELRDQAIKMDRRHGNRLRIKSTPW